MSTNRWAAPCARCDKIVEPGEGFATGKPGAWHVVHDSCIPVAKSTEPNWDEVLRPWIIGQEYDL